MSLQEQLATDLKEAMKSRDDVRKSVIRNVMTAITESEAQRRDDLLKKALKKHNVVNPGGGGDMAAYEQAVTDAMAAEQVEENSKLAESDILSVIQKLVKMRQDSISDAEKAGRNDIIESEQVELEILQTYLPKQMSREEIEAEARALIAETGASEMRDMGKVMGPLTSKLQGRADGKLISEVVRGLLSG